MKLPNQKTQKWILVGILVLFLLGNLYQCNRQSHTELSYNQNIEALTDSIRSYESENGSLVYEKKSLLTSVKTLRRYNQDLADEVKYLHDNPITITKFKTKIVHDTVEIPVYIDNEGITWNSDSTKVYIPFNWKDSTFYSPGNYRTLAGDFIIEVDTSMNAQVNEFKVTNNDVGLSFTTGITENKDKKLEIFIRSDYPGFVPTSIEGAVLDPRDSEVIKSFFPPKRWGLSAYGGYGAYMDITKGTAGHGIQLGVGLTYSIFQWNFKK